MSDSFIKVIDIQILTLANRDGTPDPRANPLLRFELEDGRDFMMSGIPHEIALNISLELNGVQSQDSRLQIHELVGELAVIKKVEIDLLMPGTDVYQATVTVVPEGFERELQYQMIPSHATLLAVLNSSAIYVADSLVKQTEQMRRQ